MYTMFATIASGRSVCGEVGNRSNNATRVNSILLLETII